MDKEVTTKVEETKAAEPATTAVSATSAATEKKKPGRKPGSKTTKTAAKKTTTRGRKPAAAKAEGETEIKEKKKPGRKPAAKTRKTAVGTTTRKSSVKANVVLQYADKSVTFDTLIQNAHNVWEYDMNRKVSEIKEINLYVKPDEGRVYFVVNNSETGDYAL